MHDIPKLNITTSNPYEQIDQIIVYLTFLAETIEQELNSITEEDFYNLKIKLDAMQKNIDEAKKLAFDAQIMANR